MRDDGADELRRWGDEPAPLRLRPGSHLYRAPDGHWYLVHPGDKFVRLRVRPEHAAALADILTGTRPVAAALATVAEPVAVAALLTQLDRADLLVAAEPPPDALADRWIAVLGTNPVAAQLIHLLTTAGVGRVDHVAALPGSGCPDLVVTCAGWLPDARWRALDRWCAERRVAWHMAHVEGRQLYLGPLAVPGSTAGYADVRARRLAAAAAPQHLTAYWAHLDAGPHVPPVTWPDPGVIAVAAGILAADSLAFLQGRPIPGEGHQWEVDLVTLAIERHPVLPLPREVIVERS